MRYAHACLSARQPRSGTSLRLVNCAKTFADGTRALDAFNLDVQAARLAVEEKEALVRAQEDQVAQQQSALQQAASAKQQAEEQFKKLQEEYKARMAVTPADMMRVAKAYLVRENSVTGVLHRER